MTSTELSMSEPTAKKAKSGDDDDVYLDEDLLKHYNENGYVVMRNFFAPAEVEAVRAEIRRLIDEWYENYEKTGEEKPDWEEVVNRDPLVREGKLQPASRLSSVRRLFRMAVHVEYFKKLAIQSKMAGIARQLLGDDIKLLQSMALLKPPGTGEKRWHQDNAYFRLIPNKVMAFWIAIDKTNVENGCMHVVPGTHTHGVDEHKSPLDQHIQYSLVKLPEKEKVLPVPMNPGDALVFHGELHHYTPPNKTKDMRQAIQYHYASALCKPTVCPKDDEAKENEGEAKANNDEPGYFDCAPCVEPQFWYYRKAELLIAGHDYGGDHI